MTRERLGILVAAMAAAMVLSSVPVQLGTAELKTPDVGSWFYEGKTLEYRITNGSKTARLNFTITAMNGSVAKFTVWDHYNGSDRWTQTRYQDKNRTDLNFTTANQTFKTYLWVTESLIESLTVGDTALLGNATYTYQGVTTEHYVFENATRTYRYDIEKGWLDEASYPQNVAVELLDDRDENVQTKHTQHCYDPGEDSHADWLCRTLTTGARASIGDNGDCIGNLKGSGWYYWPGFHLFRYYTKVNLDGTAYDWFHFAGSHGLLRTEPVKRWEQDPAPDCHAVVTADNWNLAGGCCKDDKSPDSAHVRVESDI